jgi:tRNA(Ser,Leu) C12 N-acetylase TAN1
MESEEQCEKAGQKIFNSKDLDSPNNVHHSQMIQNVRYICVLGK